MPSPSARQSGPHDDRFRQALQALDSGIALVDASGRWTDVNPAFAQALGPGEADPLGRPAAQSVADGDDRARFETGLAACLASGRRFEQVLRWHRADGDARAMRTRLAPLHDAHGERCGAVVQVDPVAAGDAGSASRDAVQRPLQLFADKVAHDLRAPLRSIESFSTLLARRAAERLDETDRNHLDRIRAAAERMGGLLTALGEYSRAMQAELRPAPVDLSLLAEWIGAELREADPGRAAELQVDPGLTAWGDERLLKLMLAQVLGNAWKFSRNCERIAIEIAGEHDRDRLRIHVRDRGCGFDMQYSHKLFEPFQRLHGVEEGGGHGLGLAIAQCVAQRHGGLIRARSEPDTGSVFTIELPATAMAEKVADA